MRLTLAGSTTALGAIVVTLDIAIHDMKLNIGGIALTVYAIIDSSSIRRF